MYYAVDIPWGFPKPKEVIYDAEKKVSFYRGPILPAKLRPFQAQEFSRERWHEDEKNGIVSPITPGNASFTPKPHQIEAAKKIADSYARGWSGFLLADKTGIGKTLSALVGASIIAKANGHDQKKKATLLIVCPKSVIPVWRQTIRNYRMAHPLLRPLIINYDQLAKLLETPPEARVTNKRTRKSRQTARSGRPLMKFDLVIFDEAHMLKNYPSSNVSLMASRIAYLDKAYRKGDSPFTIFATATPGSTPLNMSVMSGFMAKLIAPDLKQHVPPAKWGEFLESQKFHVTKGKKGWNWVSAPWFGKNSSDPKEVAKYEKGLREAKEKQRKDALRIGKALTSKHAPFIMRSPKDINGWPEQQLIAVPVELTAKQKAYYDEAWTRFKNWLNLTPAKSDPKGALVENLRYRQKTSLLRIDDLLDITLNALEEDQQVYVSFEFLESLDVFKEALMKKKVNVAEISGRTTDYREEERLMFQRGEAKVVVSTVVAGISLHASETLPDGTKATDCKRLTILADIRQNPNDSLQALGRAHRDGQNSISLIPYIEDSVDRKVVESFINKAINQEIMMGKGQAEAEELEAIFRVAAAKTPSPNTLS